MPSKRALLAAVMLVALCTALSCSRSNPNSPPGAPAVPTGPAHCFKDSTYTYTTMAIDPDSDDLAYGLYWGDSASWDWAGWFNSGDTVALTHVWHDTGAFELRARAEDRGRHLSDLSGPLSVVVFDRSTDTPAEPTRPDSGDPGLVGRVCRRRLSP